MVDRKAIKRLSTLAIVFTGANESRETFSQLPFASCWGSLSIFRQIDSLCRMSKCIEQPKPRASRAAMPPPFPVIGLFNFWPLLAPRARQRLAMVLREIFCSGTRAKRAWFNHGQIQIYEMDMSHVGTCQSTHSWNLLWSAQKRLANF